MNPVDEGGGTVVAGGRSVNAWLMPPVALTIAVDLPLTAPAWAVNVALVIPVPIVTDAGTDKLALVELSEKL